LNLPADGPEEDFWLREERESMEKKGSAEQAVREIRRRTRRRFPTEEKIRMVIEGLRGEESVASLCRREGIATNLYYRWGKEFLEAGRKRLPRDTQREATSSEVTDLRKENTRLKELSEATRSTGMPG
jgi:transposase